MTNYGKKLIALDADDTLWTNMPFFHEAVEKINGILKNYMDVTSMPKEFYAIEKENISILGYGVKSFIITMVEAAIEASERKIRAGEIREIISIGKSLMDSPVELLEDVGDVVAALSEKAELMLITKGELLEQKRKIVCSGLSDYFGAIEIVSEKEERTYSEILEKHGVEPGNFLMVGDSLKSDVLPVLNIGGSAAHIPSEAAWHHEKASADDAPREYYILKSIRELPELIQRIGFFGD